MVFFRLAFTTRENASPSRRFREEIDGENKAHRDDEAFDYLRGHPLRRVEPGGPSRNRANRHDDRPLPMDQTGNDECDNRRRVHQYREQNFQAVHQPNVAEPEKGERGKHKNANAAAEIAAVDGDQSLRGENAGSIQPQLFRVGDPKIPAREDRRREQDKPRHDTAEDNLGRNEKQETPNEAAGNAYRGKGRHIYAAVGRSGGETVARGITGRNLAREQRDGA